MNEGVRRSLDSIMEDLINYLMVAYGLFVKFDNCFALFCKQLSNGCK